MKFSKIFLILIIGIISLNLLFAGSMSRKYRISGNLVITPALNNACNDGGSWDDGTQIEHDDQEPQKLSIANIFEKLFFSAPTQDPDPLPPSSCSLEIYSPNNTLVLERTDLTAQAIKEGLELGVMTPPITINSSQSVLNFKVIIRHYQNDAILLETTIPVPNINSGAFINADNVQAPVADSAYALSHGAAPVLMLRQNADGELEPIWKRIDTFNISGGGAIPQDDLEIVDRNVTGKNGWLLSWDAQSNKMKWSNQITSSVIMDGTLLPQDFDPNTVFSKIGGTIVTESNPQFITAEQKYLKFTQDGVEYYIKVDRKVTEPSVLEVGGDETIPAGNNITKTAQAVSLSSLNWTVPSGVQIISGQGTNTVVLRGTTSGSKTITLTGVSTNNGATLTDTFTLNVTEPAYINAGPDVSVTGTTPYTVIKTIQRSGVTNVQWVASSSNVTITTDDSGSGGKRLTSTAPGNYTITVSGTSNATGATVSDTFIYHPIYSGGGTSGGGTGGGGTGGNCFSEGTPVLTDTGYRAIETIRSGDYVYAYDDKTDKLVLTRVNSLLVHNTIADSPTVKLMLSNGKNLTVTTNHAFYDPIAKAYKQLKYFTIGDKLAYVVDGKITTVDIVSLTKLKDLETSYNLSLEYPNNYLVDGIIVHNDYKHDATTPAEDGGCYAVGPYGILVWTSPCGSIR